MRPQVHECPVVPRPWMEALIRHAWFNPLSMDPFMFFHTETVNTKECGPIYVRRLHSRIDCETS